MRTDISSPQPDQQPKPDPRPFEPPKKTAPSDAQDDGGSVDVAKEDEDA